MKTENSHLVLSLTIIVIVAVLSIGIVLYSAFYSSMTDSMAKNQRQILEQVNLNLDNYLRSMMGVSDTMYYRVIKNANLAETGISNEMSLFYDAHRDKLVSLAVFSDAGEVIAAYPLSSLKPTASVVEQDWFLRAQNQIENLHFSTPHVQNLFDNLDFRYNWVVSLSRKIDMTYDGEIRHGVLLVDMNVSGIEQICRRVNLGINGYVYIVDRSGELIYHPAQQLIYAGLVGESNEFAASQSDGSRAENFNGQSRFISTKTVGYTGWKIVAVSYMSEITPYSEILAFVLLLVLFAVSIMIFVHKFADEHEQKRKSELNALQSQINPHFLYNTMDSIVWVLESGDTRKGVTMITALSRLFRISISKGRNIITVRDELEHARNYLTIQDIRFAGRFTYEINAEPEVLEMSTIKLIVQPVVENSINHGMEYKDGDGLIQINAYVRGGDLFIEISDNGLGMPEETAKKLLAAPSQSTSGGSGIGLYNIKERIRLYFGGKYGLSIHSVPDEGTRVTIHLPAKRHGDE